MDPPPPSRGDPIIIEAAALAGELMASPHRFQHVSAGMVLLRRMFREDGPLAALRWSRDELIPVVERHLHQMMAEVEDKEELRDRLFDRCAPELLSPERVERFDQELRRVLMEPGRTPEERRALAVAVLEMRGVPRHPPYMYWRHWMVAWLMMAQVTEWSVGFEHMNASMQRALEEEPREWSEPEMSGAAEADPPRVEDLSEEEESILLSILHGRTPEVLHGEEWLWMTLVLREPLRIEPEQAEDVDVEALLMKLDEEVKQAILSRVEAGSQDQASLPEEQRWFEWAYKVMQVRPLAFFGAFAQALDAPLREHFEGEAHLVKELQGRERWRAEDLEPYRLNLEARGAHGAEQRVRRLQALLRGEEPPGGAVFTE